MIMFSRWSPSPVPQCTPVPRPPKLSETPKPKALPPYTWVHYYNSLTWIKAIWGWFPLQTMIIVRPQWGRYNLPSYMVRSKWQTSSSKSDPTLTVFLQHVYVKSSSRYSPDRRLNHGSRKMSLVLESSHVNFWGVLPRCSKATNETFCPQPTMAITAR